MCLRVIVHFTGDAMLVFHIIDMYYSIDVKIIKAIITYINAHLIVGSLNSHFKVELFENQLTRFSNRSYYMIIIIVESV